MKPPMMGAAPGGAKMPSPQEVQSLLSEIDSVIGKPGEEGSSPQLPMEEKFSTTMAEPANEPGMADVTPIADALDVSMEKAQATYDAAQQMEQTKGKSPSDLADMLSTNMGLRMQLEKNMGAGEDMKMRKSMSEAPMSAPPPMEPTPAGGMK
jgi:hypothetical protein